MYLVELGMIIGIIQYFLILKLITTNTYLTDPASRRAKPACMKNTIIAIVKRKKASILGFKHSKSNDVLLQTFAIE